ncbi:hypothetical protein EDB84DRAFT_1434045 [Lactarius hengduanensis]|nr:hypothetical protein EDB84DRAFT_1434045 [Lactarius hengduanensis]
MSSEEDIQRQKPQKKKAKAHSSTSDKSDTDHPQASKGKKKGAIEVVDDDKDIDEVEVNKCPEDRAEEEENEDLDENQSAGIPALFRTKKGTTWDFLTIFTVKVLVSFNKGRKRLKGEPQNGRWCTVCKDEVEEDIRTKRRLRHTLRQCFLTGSNTSCRNHICSYHYEEYKA